MYNIPKTRSKHVRYLVASCLLIISSLTLLLCWKLSSVMHPAQPEGLQHLNIIRPARALPQVHGYDSQGKPWTQQQLRGHWTLLFFGYKNCPDICPATLAQIAQLWQQLPAQQLRFIFVSLTNLFEVHMASGKKTKTNTLEKTK